MPARSSRSYSRALVSLSGPAIPGGPRCGPAAAGPHGHVAGDPKVRDPVGPAAGPGHRGDSAIQQRPGKETAKEDKADLRR